LPTHRTSYCEAAEAADDAASIADEAAIIDEVAAADAELSAAIELLAGAIAAGVVVVVVVDVSSFLLQAAKETAAASVTMSNAVFIFLLDWVVRTMTGNCGNPFGEGPQRSKTRKAWAFPVPNYSL
jgi:hypothetical protein